MGVRGLFRYCTEYFPKIAVEYDLLGVVNNQGAVELIVDFYAFEYWIFQHMSALMARADNPWAELSGGEYSVIHSLVTSLLHLFEEAGITPIFVMDGAKLSSNAQAEFKFNEWIRRDINDYGRVKKMLDMVSGDIPLGSLKRQEFIRPVLIEVEMIRCFRKLGVEIRCCCSGEADMFIAKLFNDRRAFAILSNDSDFLLFPNCCMINLDSHFDTDQHLRQKLTEAYENGPSKVHLDRLLVRCIKSNDVAEGLRLENVDQICDFAFLRGNDTSKPFADTIHATLGVSPNDLSGMVRIIHKNQPLNQEPTIAAMCKEVKGFREAYEMSHNFYKLNVAAMPSDNDPVTHPDLEHFICLGVSQLKLSPNFLAISRGCHWCRVMVEVIKFQAVNPVSERAMSSFRQFLYHMTLSRSLPANLATEYSVLPHPEIGMKELRSPIPQLDWLPRANEIDGLPREERIELFHEIMSHLEPKPKSHKIYWELRDWPLAFCTYVCRYFYCQNFHRNLHIKHEEMLAVIASVFGTTQSNILITNSLPCKPSARSLTIAAWLQNVYRYAGNFLAQILKLEDFTPAPHDFFSGSVFTSFFYCDTADENNMNSSIRRICNIKAQILRENVRAVNLILANSY